MPVEERPHVVGRDGLDVSRATGRVAAERMIGEQLLGEQPVGDVVRAVVVHRDLFEDDLALGLDVVVAATTGR